MRNLNAFLCAVVVGMITSASFAQPKSAPAWSAKFKTAIHWQRVHPLGNIIVGTNDGIYSVNPADGKIIWENKSFPALDPSMLQPIEGTEFISIAYKTDPGSTIPKQAIIEVIGGKVLFDSQKENIGVLSRHVLPQSGHLLVIGVKQHTELKDMVATLFMYEIATGKQMWVNDNLFKPDAPAGKGFFGKLQAMGQQLGNLQKLTSEPLELDNQNVIVTHPMYVMKLKSATGELVWKQAIQPSKVAKVMFSPYKKGIVFVGAEIESDQGSGFTTSSGSQSNQPKKFYTNVYYGFDAVTGNPIWKEPAKENDLLNQVIMHEKGIIICPRSSQKPTINLINYETGQTMWGNKGKGIKAQGSVVSYIPIEKSYLITTAFDNAWNDKAEEYYLNALDPNSGSLKFEKSVKLKGDLVRSELVPKGLLFITSREVNIMDIASGSLLWENSIEAGAPITNDKVRPFPTGQQGDKIFVYSPKESGVFEVDKVAGTSKKITAAKIQFEGKELPRSIDVVSDGLVLSSEQNVMKLGLDGTLKFAKYYPAPREPALVRALLAAQAVRAAYIGAAAGAYSDAFADAARKSNDQASKQLGQGMSQAFGQLENQANAYSSQAMKQYSARYKASQTTPNFVIMMTTQEKKGYQLVQISKTNGEIMASIDIKNDKEPEYDLDQIYNYVYYRPNPNEIVCYKLEGPK